MMIEEGMEKDITLVTPENVVPNGNMEQNLTANAIPIGSLSPLRSDEKVQSRYLRSSVASCHDHCKFGKKHDFEAASPSLRTFLKKNAVRDKEKNQVATPKGGEMGLRTVTKLKVETESIPESDFSDKPDLPKPKTPARTKKTITPGEKKTLLTSGDSKKCQVKSPIPRDEKKTKVIKRRTPLQSQSSPDKINVINSTDLSPASEANALEDPSSIKENTESADSGPISSLAPTEIKSDLTPHDEKKRKVNKRRTQLQSPSSPDKLNVIKLTDLSPSSQADPSEDPGSIKETIELTINEPIPSLTPMEIKQKAPSLKKLRSIKRAPIPLKRDVSGRSSIVLKTKTPMIRAMSQLKSSRSLIARRNQEKKPAKTIGTLKLGGFSSKPMNTLKTTKAPLLRSISTRRNQEKITSSGLSEVGEGSATPANTSKTKTLPTRPVSQLKPSRSLNARGNQERKITKNLDTSNITERKVLKPPPAPSSSKPSRNGFPSLLAGKLRNLMRSTSVKNKDKVGGANSKKLENTDLDRSRKIENSGSAANELINGRLSKGENKRGSRRTSTVRPQDSIPTPYKLKFKPGKVLDLRCDSIGARRLWFRIGKMAGDNQNSNSLGWRRSFRKKDIGGSDSTLPNSESQIVILKHQATLKKKDAQALFNHVIEETASKLVETRKSKVKALVGAFETVISLQESKPASVV